MTFTKFNYSSVCNMMHKPLRIQNSGCSLQSRSIVVIKFLDWSFELPARTELRYTGQEYLFMFISGGFCCKSISDASSRMVVTSRDSWTGLSSSSFLKYKKKKNYYIWHGFSSSLALFAAFTLTS